MVGIVKDHEGFLDCSDQLGLVLKQVRIQNCKSKIFKKLIFVYYYLMGSLRFGLLRFMRVCWKAETNMRVS